MSLNPGPGTPIPRLVGRAPGIDGRGFSVGMFGFTVALDVGYPFIIRPELNQRLAF